MKTVILFISLLTLCPLKFFLLHAHLHSVGTGEVSALFNKAGWQKVLPLNLREGIMPLLYRETDPRETIPDTIKHHSATVPVRISASSSVSYWFYQDSEGIWIMYPENRYGLAESYPVVYVQLRGIDSLLALVSSHFSVRVVSLPPLDHKEIKALNLLMKKVSGSAFWQLVVIYQNHLGEWVITIFTSHGAVTLNLGLYFESLISLTFEENIDHTRGWNTPSVILKPHRQGKIVSRPVHPESSGTQPASPGPYEGNESAVASDQNTGGEVSGNAPEEIPEEIPEEETSEYVSYEAVTVLPAGSYDQEFAIACSSPSTPNLQVWVERLNEGRIDPSGQYQGTSFLQSAIQVENVELVTVLIQHGANLVGTGLDGTPPAVMFFTMGSWNNHYTTVIYALETAGDQLFKHGLDAEQWLNEEHTPNQPRGNFLDGYIPGAVAVLTGVYRQASQSQIMTRLQNELYSLPYNENKESLGKLPLPEEVYKKIRLLEDYNDSLRSSLVMEEEEKLIASGNKDKTNTVLKIEPSEEAFQQPEQEALVQLEVDIEFLGQVQEVENEIKAEASGKPDYVMIDTKKFKAEREKIPEHLLGYRTKEIERWQKEIRLLQESAIKAKNMVRRLTAKTTYLQEQGRQISELNTELLENMCRLYTPYFSALSVKDESSGMEKMMQSMSQKVTQKIGEFQVRLSSRAPKSHSISSPEKPAEITPKTTAPPETVEWDDEATRKLLQLIPFPPEKLQPKKKADSKNTLKDLERKAGKLKVQGTEWFMAPPQKDAAKAEEQAIVLKKVHSKFGVYTTESEQHAMRLAAQVAALEAQIQQSRFVLSTMLLEVINHAHRLHQVSVRKHRAPLIPTLEKRAIEQVAASELLRMNKKSGKEEKGEDIPFGEPDKPDGSDKKE